MSSERLMYTQFTSCVYRVSISKNTLECEINVPHACCFLIIFRTTPMLIWHPPSLPFLYYSKYYLIFYSPVAKLMISVRAFQYQNFSTQIWRKTCQKLVKKDPYIGSIVHWRCILLILKVHILFFLVCICSLSFTIYT